MKKTKKIVSFIIICWLLLLKRHLFFTQFLRDGLAFTIFGGFKLSNKNTIIYFKMKIKICIF